MRQPSQVQPPPSATPRAKAVLAVCRDGSEVSVRIDYQPGREEIRFAGYGRALEYLQEKGFRQPSRDASCWYLG